MTRHGIGLRIRLWLRSWAFEFSIVMLCLLILYAAFGCTINVLPNVRIDTRDLKSMLDAESSKPPIVIRDVPASQPTAGDVADTLRKAIDQ